MFIVENLENTDNNVRTKLKSYYLEMNTILCLYLFP